MRLIVHAGPGRTGATAIQKSLLAAAGSLRARGVLYLGLMLERGPVKLYPWQRAGGFDEFHGLPNELAKRDLDRLLRETLAAASAAGVETLVVSNESLLRRGHVFLETLEHLRNEGVGLHVVAYARRYDELARAAYVQWGLNHKTYEGPLKNFRQWMEGRELALSPSALHWRSKLGSDFQLRNFDACGNVATDFLEATGLPDAGGKDLEPSEMASANEIALRALFNEQQPGATSPSRFTQLFRSSTLAFDRPLQDWLGTLMPNEQELAGLAAHFADETSCINQLLSSSSQPPLDEAVLDRTALRIDPGAMLGTLFQLIAQQALRIESLERAMAAPLASVDAAGGEPHTVSQPAASRSVDAAVGAALAPALGYFGANPSDHLQLALPGKAREIWLRLSEPKSTFLNLRGMELRYRGKPLDGSVHRVATQSSVAGNDPRNGPDCLLAQAGIHSAAEKTPWWRVVFDRPVEVDELRLWNRSDGWGSRSRSLTIDVIDHEGTSLRVYDGQSSQNLAAILAAASAAADIGEVPVPETEDAARALHRTLMAAIAARIGSGAIALQSIDWRRVVPLLDLWGSNEPSADEWVLIAGFLLTQQQAKGGTSIKSLSLLLNSQARLQRLQGEINQLARALGLGGFMLTRHGVKPDGVLRREPERFLAHMEAVLGTLGRLGREPALAYGTLLGAVRDGHFIAHDDDIDLLYRSTARSRADVEAEFPSIKEAFRADGFKVVDLLPNSLNMHVIDPRNGAVMDVFPCWEEDGRLQMHMESMQIRGIDPRIVYPTQPITFLGKQLPAPGDAQAYLEERYGPGWRVSDQFFEWPWALKE